MDGGGVNHCAVRGVGVVFLHAAKTSRAEFPPGFAEELGLGVSWAAFCSSGHDCGGQGQQADGVSPVAETVPAAG